MCNPVPESQFRDVQAQDTNRGIWTPHALFITILAEVLMLHVGRRPRNVLEQVGGGFRESPSPFAPYRYPCLMAVIFLLMVIHTKHKQGLPEGLLAPQAMRIG